MNYKTLHRLTDYLKTTTIIESLLLMNWELLWAPFVSIQSRLCSETLHRSRYWHWGYTTVNMVRDMLHSSQIWPISEQYISPRISRLAGHYKITKSTTALQKVFLCFIWRATHTLFVLTTPRTYKIDIYVPGRHLLVGHQGVVAVQVHRGFVPNRERVEGEPVQRQFRQNFANQRHQSAHGGGERIREAPRRTFENDKELVVGTKVKLTRVPTYFTVV
jgi:hypothetical protein